MKLETKLAQALGFAIEDVREDELAFLDAIKEEETQKCYFACLVLRMPLAGLKPLYEKGAKPSEVFEKRNEYLVELASKRDQAVVKAEELSDYVERLVKQDNALKEKLSTVLGDAKQATERERAALMDQIQMLKTQQEDDRKRLQEYEEQIRNLKKERLINGSEAAVRKRKEENPAADDDRYEATVSGFFERRKNKKNIELFFDALSKTEGLSDAQKDCLINCLEEGYSAALISKVMRSNLSVGQMKKFIKIYAKEMGGKQ